MALSMAQAKRYARQLQDTVLFCGIPEEEIAAYLQMEGVRLRRYAQGETILAQGSATAQLGILLRGRAVVQKQSGQKVLRMSELQAGALFGMASLFAQDGAHAYPTQIEAGTACNILLIAEQTFRQMLQWNAVLLEQYLRYLTGRIHFLSARIEGLSSPNAKEHALLYMRQNQTDGQLTHSITVMAQALGIGRATLYRALDALQEEGKILRQGRSIRLLEECVLPQYGE